MVIRSGPLAPGVAFVTGGARGLGNAIAVSFAKEGARGVVIVDINDEETLEQGKKNVEQYGAKVGPDSIPPEERRPTTLVANRNSIGSATNLASDHGKQCITVRADVTKESDVERAVEEAVKAFGRIDYAA